MLSGVNKFVILCVHVSGISLSEGAKGTVARQGSGGAGGGCAASLGKCGSYWILWFTSLQEGEGRKVKGPT